MPWGHEKITMNRGAMEADESLFAAADDAGLSLRAIHGKCSWAFNDIVQDCTAFALKRMPNQGLGGYATRSLARGEWPGRFIDVTALRGRIIGPY